MLNTEGLKVSLMTGIKSVLDEEINENLDSEFVKNRFATKLADVIANSVDVWIKTATVNVLPGIPVSTNTGAGSTTGPGVGTIS